MEGAPEILAASRVKIRGLHPRGPSFPAGGSGVPKAPRRTTRPSNSVVTGGLQAGAATIPLGYPCDRACACSSGTEMRVRLKSPPLVRVGVAASLEAPRPSPEWPRLVRHLG